jgi:hypothetical protein
MPWLVTPRREARVKIGASRGAILVVIGIPIQQRTPALAQVLGIAFESGTAFIVIEVASSTYRLI